MAADIVTTHVKLLGVTIDNALKFDTHVHAVCSKANQKLHAFGRLRVLIRHVNSGGGLGGVTPPQCLENTIGIGKSLTSLGICWLDEDTFLGKLAMLG